MYIIQMADFHIGSKTKASLTEERIMAEYAEAIKVEIPHDEDVMLCLCGDMIDSTGLKITDKDEAQKRYEAAAGLIQGFLKDLETRYKVSVKCCIGNHDITHEKEFHAFVKAVDAPGNLPLESLKGCYSCKISGENAYAVFVNSCEGNQYETGRIDYDGLERLLEALPKDSDKILALHHTVMSMDEEDDSSIRNAARLLGIIEKYKISGVLHGHIHGREILEIGGNGCKLIGTGAVFSRDNADVNSQFNIIQYNDGKFTKVLNCCFHADGGNARWDNKDILEKTGKGRKTESGNIFSGRSFQEIYEQLERKLNLAAPLYNVVMQIDSDYTSFHKELEKYLENDKLEMGKKPYNYFQLAEMWQREEVPDELYFNHGSYFKVGSQNGIDYIEKQLKDKPTSNRIVLPTYNMRNVADSLDDRDYLPSLVSIQFGIDEERNMLVHMHLRALEASRFLKINICEIDYILGELHRRSVDFSKIRLLISAFRVQRKEKFTCFLKAGIDMIPGEDLAAEINQKKFTDIIDLLKEKRDCKETITQTEGIENVYKYMRGSNKIEDKDAPLRYGDKLISTFEETLKVYKQLDAIHKKRSVRSSEEKQCEEKIDRLLEEIIQELKKLAQKKEGNTR